MTPWETKWRPILEAIAAKYSTSRKPVTVELMTSHNDRHSPVAKARQEAYYVLRKVHRLSYPRIARMLGRYDHSTIVYGVGAHMERNGIPGPERDNASKKRIASAARHKLRIAKFERVKAHAYEGRGPDGRFRSDRTCAEWQRDAGDQHGRATQGNQASG